MVATYRGQDRPTERSRLHGYIARLVRLSGVPLQVQGTACKAGKLPHGRQDTKGNRIRNAKVARDRHKDGGSGHFCILTYLII